MAKRICVLQDFLRMGGTEQNSLALCSHLQEQGNRVTLLTARPGGPLAKSADRASFEIKQAQPFDFRINWFPPQTLGLIQEISPDRCILMGRVANEIGWRIKSRFPEIELVATIRTGRPFTRNYAKTLHAADWIDVNSDYARQRAIQVGVDAQRVRLVSNFEIHALSNEERLQSRDSARERLKVVSLERRICLMVGAFRPGKRHKDLIRLFAEIEYPNCELWFVGAGPEEKKCQELVRAMDLSQRIKFMGMQSELQDYYYAADSAISLSLEESNSNFIQEAKRAGLPIFARKSGGTFESNDSADAQIRWFESDSALKDALTRWLEKEKTSA